jgi:serine/threonine protein kinase HipA of HipAB toxin-antitoxin module
MKGRVTFNMLIGNADMHMKNWSLIYPDRRYVSLAPAYDFVATLPYIPGDATNMKISRRDPHEDSASPGRAFIGQFTGVEAKHFVSLGA